MSRVLLLVLFLLWMTGTSDLQIHPSMAPLGVSIAGFFAFYVALVLLMRVLSVRVARRVASSRFARRVDRLNFMMSIARLLIPAWFAVGIFMLGWGWIVEEKLGLGHQAISRLPSALLGTLPAMLAWAGLWWSQFPAERALREQNLLVQLNEDLPMHAPPTFWAYFCTSLRLQVLFTILPVLMMIFVRDFIGVVALNHLPGHGTHTAPDNSDDMAELLSWIAAAALVFMVAPELLRRVLRTQPLRDGPMRRRLEAVCRRANVRYREILFWDTDHTMGNAAVMGIIPWMRYILLSDVLIESMTDDQIEAVFAHEVGHVVHRHMVWFVVFFGVLFTAAMCVDRLVENTQWFSTTTMVAGSLIGSATAFWLGLGFLSRRFERQADVFAARMIQRDREGTPADAPATSIVLEGLTEGPGFVMGARPAVAAGCIESAPAQTSSTYVGHYGATLFGSALHRVARVNNIPIARNEWLHGSIAKRMQYLRHLSTDPALTIRFDRLMARLYGGLLFALIATTVWLIVVH